MGVLGPLGEEQEAVAQPIKITGSPNDIGTSAYWQAVCQEMVEERKAEMYSGVRPYYVPMPKHWADAWSKFCHTPYPGTVLDEADSMPYSPFTVMGL